MIEELLKHLILKVQSNLTKRFFCRIRKLCVMSEPKYLYCNLSFYIGTRSIETFQIIRSYLKNLIQIKIITFICSMK